MSEKQTGRPPFDSEANGSKRSGSGHARLQEMAPGSRLAARVARQIVSYIDENGIGPGDRLPLEREMVEQLAVSRGTLREALRMLDVHGLLVLKPGPSGGPVVQQMQGRQLGLASTLHFHMAGATYREIWEARLTMEPVMARLAAQRQPAETRNRLAAAMENARAKEQGEDSAYVSAVSDYHTTVSAMSGNRVLDLWAVSFAEIWLIALDGMPFPAEGRQMISVAHEDITRAVVEGDADRAYHLMYRHNAEMMEFVDRQYPGLLDSVIPFFL